MPYLCCEVTVWSICKHIHHDEIARLNKTGFFFNFESLLITRAAITNLIFMCLLSSKTNMECLSHTHTYA